MNLYRMTYVREGSPKGTTFVGKSDEWAYSFAAAWCQSLGVVLLTVKELRPIHQPRLELVP